MITLPTIEQVPEELRPLKRWIAYRLVSDESKQKFSKKPHSPVTGEAIGAVLKYAEHFLTFEEARAGVEKFALDGLGFVFCDGDGFCGIDFDDCVKDAAIEPRIANWLKFFPTYKEFSPSGTGVHVICKGQLARALTATPLPEADGAKVEIYSAGRYFTFTGQRLGDDHDVLDCQSGLDKILGHLGQVNEASGQGPGARCAPTTKQAATARFEEQCEELRHAPEGAGNSTLNDVAFFGGQAFAAGALPDSESSYKNRLFHIVTKEWERPHDTPGAHGTIQSGWNSGKMQPLNIIEIETATVAELIRPDMPASVLCGGLGEICRTRLGDFPIAYAWPAILAAASALVKPHPKNRCNLYVAAVGPADSGKSESQNRANYLFGLKESDRVVDDKFGSAEGMLEKIGDRGGEAVLWSPDELSHVLVKAQIQGASFPFILNTLFYQDRNNSTVAHRKVIPFNARITISGGVVEENFGDSFGSATTAGLYSRFLFGLCPGGFRYLYRPMEGEPIVAADDPFGSAQSGPPVQFETPIIHPDVWAARDEICREEKIEPRLLELVIRAALICAAWDRRLQLRAADLGPAWELARYQQRVRGVLEPNPGRNYDAMAAHKILSYVAQHAGGEKYISWRDVHRATHVVRDFGPNVADRALGALCFAGELDKAEIAPPSGGRKQMVIRLARD